MNKRYTKYYVGDFETTVFDGQTSTEVWASACVELNTEDVKIFHSIDEQWKFFCDIVYRDNCDLTVYYEEHSCYRPYYPCGFPAVCDKAPAEIYSECNAPVDAIESARFLVESCVVSFFEQLVISIVSDACKHDHLYSDGYSYEHSVNSEDRKYISIV